jgi:hypothetical protein
MADRSFEAELERAFAEAPAFADADLFRLRIARALGRGWAFRRVVIGALGFAGGLIGGAQFLRAGILVHLGSVARAGRLLWGEATRLPAAHGLSEVMGSGATMDSEVLWMSGALALLAVGLFVTRTIRDF